MSAELIREDIMQVKLTSPLEAVPTAECEPDAVG